MKDIKINAYTIILDGIKFYHYSKADKNNSTQFITYNGVTYHDKKA